MNVAGKRSDSSNTADKDFRKQTDNDIFALDIGTRTVIGVLGHTDDDVFFVDDTVTVPHKSRAMTDGQIEDIAEVARVVGRVRSELEERNKIKLENVSVAAAGRALRTARVQHEADIEDKGHISSDVVRSIEMEAVAEAQSSLGLYPTQVLFPALVTALMMIAFHLISNSLRDAVDMKTY